MANIELLRKNLEFRGFQTSYFSTAEECRAYLNRELDGCTIGFSSSMTVLELGLYETLSTHNTCFWHWDKESKATPRDAAGTEVYFCSLNGVAETGELVNIDRSGNRLASGLFGHRKVYFVIGTNKISPDLDSAIHRARNIAAPLRAQQLGMNTPCAVKGDRCYDCKSPDRICRAMLLYWTKPAGIREAEIVIVDEKLGL